MCKHLEAREGLGMEGVLPGKFLIYSLVRTQK